jgi:hypothetical protein
MNKSDSIKELATALSIAQGEMCGAIKGKLNPAFKGSKYADLGAIIDAVKEPFCTNGLSYSQFPIFRDGFVGVETMLMHVSGEWMCSELLLPMVKQDPQAAGSAITYARRYSLQSIAGIPSEDDDGNAASTPSKQAAPVKKSDYTALIAKYKSLDMDGQTEAWSKMNPAQQAAVSEALS